MEVVAKGFCRKVYEELVFFNEA